MARLPTRRSTNGAVRRVAKRQRASNSRGMHLSAAEIGTRQALQRRWAVDIVSTGNTLFDLSASLFLRSQIPDPAFTAAVDRIIALLTAQAVAYLVQTSQWIRLDSDLYDIPLHEYLQNREFRPRQHLRLDNIESDLHARKMTRFNLHQLRRIYECFGLEDYCHSMDSDYIRIYTGHNNQRGVPCCYRFHPEELFLYCLTKIAKGNTSDENVDNYFGGAYSRWTLGFPWLLYYLDERYQDVLGFQGLQRRAGEFGRFQAATERYLKQPRTYVDNENNETVVVDGLPQAPFPIIGMIDASLYQTCICYAGPHGDYAHAPRRPEYALFQRSIFTGWKKRHGMKILTVYLPDGTSYVFGPNSMRRSDNYQLSWSGLDEFVDNIQLHLRPTERGNFLGDLIFAGALARIRSYYTALPGNPLTAYERRVNAALKSMRQPIEKNYAMNSCVMKICVDKNAFKLAKNNNYCVELLRVVHLMINIYICFNGDQGGSVNTFGLTPQRLEDYLQL